MAVTKGLIDVGDDGWTDLTPGITGTAATVINQGGLIHLRVQVADPGAGVEGGMPLPTGDGFLKQTLSEMSFDSGTLHVWARARGGSSRVWCEHETA